MIDSYQDCPFSYQERLLILEEVELTNLSSSNNEEMTRFTSMSYPPTVSVRLESLSQWKQDTDNNVSSTTFAPPVVDLLEGSRQLYIDKVHMSIASHSTQQFPATNYSSLSLDYIPILMGSISTNHVKALPQGFFLQIESKEWNENEINDKRKTKQQEVQSVQNIFEDMIRYRLLTTPVTGAKWDVRKVTIKKENNIIITKRVYQIFLPFNGAGWSSDALQQSMEKTIPTNILSSSLSSSNKNKNINFFGWSSLQWSNFLVGNIDDFSLRTNSKKQSIQQQPIRKQMWWTWTASSHSTKQLSFGIQYQAILIDSSSSKSDYSWKNWLPNDFVTDTLSPSKSQYSTCPVGQRNMYQVVSKSFSDSDTSTIQNVDLLPLPSDNELIENTTSSPPLHTILSIQPSSFPYRASIDQVFRRHHTNYGIFESWIDIEPLNSALNKSTMPLTCEMVYRQVLPNFISPIWQSLVITDDNTNAKASVEWNPNEQSSVLYVTAMSGFLHHIRQEQENQVKRESMLRRLPSTLTISFEYAPAFLTLDDFPGDPNRGRELPPAHLTIHCKDPKEDYALPEVSVYSNGLLLLPPVPDLSMPFNVISLTSSLYAYIVGTLVTILVRKASEKIKYKLYPNKKPKSKLEKLKSKIKNKLARLRGKTTRNNSKERTESETDKVRDEPSDIKEELVSMKKEEDVAGEINE